MDATRTSDATPQRIDARHLPNPVQIHPKVISGGLPAGDEAFDELQSLGVKTIISVDGMQPDVALASRYGLRYVHLPHGYDGVPDKRVKELARAVRELDGPIYIHCHHGKHRSPTAASVACVSAGLIPPSASVAVLELAGTSPHYRGLYQSAQEARPLETALLDELDVAFPETARIPPIAETMVALEHTHDHLKTIAQAGWRSPPDHPDLDPAHEALLIQEHFTELLRTSSVQHEPESFRQMLQDSQQAARELEAALREWQSTSSSAAPPETIQRLSDRISANCKSCHQKSRDVPLSEK
jgi:protein tyrosine phosphatase (PTP) superfamily phosphohydrolase (DUF442 family)